MQVEERRVSSGSAPPATPKRPVVDTYHGVKVVDDYQWLEDYANEEVRKWTQEQNQYCRSFLDKIPVKGKLLSRVRDLVMAVSADYLGLQYQNGRLFALKSQPPKQQLFLVSLVSADDLSSEKVIMDPNEMDPKGKTSIDFFEASLDGKHVALSLSSGGTEEGSIHIYNSETGEKLPDIIPGVQYPTGGGSVTWNADSTGLYYTRYPAPGEWPEADAHFYQQVYYHKLGTPLSEDKYVIGKDFVRIAEVKLSTSKDGHYILATVANGDGGEFEHHLMNPKGEWARITEFQDQVTRAALGPDGYLYLLSRNGSPNGKILRIRLDNPKLNEAQIVVPESKVAIDDFEPANHRLYVTVIDGGPSEIRIYNHDGWVMTQLGVEPVSSVDQTLALEDDQLLFRNETFITPAAWFLYDTSTGSKTKTAMFVKAPADFSDCEVVREYATSKDGTRVPLNILKRKNLRLDGKNPALLTGYGGYGLSMTPYFRVRRRVWLDAGGIYVVANLRGGGEYGEDWHKQGNLTKKQNVFDDFIACAEHLVKEGYTSHSKLAIEGGSNGGLLMGAVLTQHPELFGAVIAYVGLFDSLRTELEPNGEYNITEFGTVKDLDQFNALYAYSPYHHVVDGTNYPPVLLTTGENDNRVSPSNSRKMTARLQAATRSDQPVLLRVNISAGHGMGTALDDQILELADGFAFLFDRLGMKIS